MAHLKKVLVANRGEIALRVIRTLREMDLSSVAVYSEADKGSLHVRAADEAYFLGPASVTESYLNVNRILDAAKQSGAQAIHPGYGFLSEDADFARACEKEKIVFIGPSASAIEAMGLKVAARNAMQKAGVSLIPGCELGEKDDPEARAQNIGYPLLVKASAGGGGKGMRIVRSQAELSSAITRARSEAKNAFGNDTVYMERALENARHIEVQVLADHQGHTFHLFERDCSLQRRHQKVIEEAPSPPGVLNQEQKARLYEMAVRAAEAVRYHSAGTIEGMFANGESYFLEMNTRLQVEHPITELITGRDLVRAQVCVARGDALDFDQVDIVQKGHAIECRLYAEDPSSGFLPSPGKLQTLELPSGLGVRVDAGYVQGDEVTSFYDPLLAKICVWAETRPLAVRRMQRALGETRILGLRSNLDFLRAIVNHSDFLEGNYHTQWIEQKMVELSAPLHQQTELAFSVAALLDHMTSVKPETEGSVVAAMSAWRRAFREEA